MIDDTPIPETIKSLRILLVDDDVFVLQLLTAMLEKFGLFDVVTATDGKAGLTIIDNSPRQIQLLICDLNMPGMDGIEFFRHLAARRYPGSILISSGSDTRLLKTVGNLLKAHQLRILDILNKPIKHSQLMNALVQVTNSSPTDNHLYTQKLTPEEVRKGITDDHVVAFFQPKISVIDNHVVGAECLARWNHPTAGLLPPSAFISVAEENGLIDALTLVIFRKAMEHLGEWTKLGHNLKISVNISMDSLQRLDLPEQLADIASKKGVDPENVMLEMTESLLMQNLSASLDSITRLRLKGFGLSIDDFGTGYSSIEKLHQLPFTELKIDRAFILGASQDPGARAILDLSVQMGRALDMRVVAEGVETQDDWDLVMASGCDEMQGYVIAKPMPAEEFIKWKQNWEINLMDGPKILR